MEAKGYEIILSGNLNKELVQTLMDLRISVQNGN
jgi:hypothetical protein